MLSTNQLFEIQRNREIFPPLNQDIAASIGQIVAEWSAVEQQLCCVFGMILQQGRYTTIAITGEMMGAQMQTVMGALLQLSGNANVLDAWNPIASELDRLRMDRNTIIHASWERQGSEDHNFLRKHKAKPGVRVKIKILTVEYMKNLFDEMTLLKINIARLPGICARNNIADILKTDNPPGFLPDHFQSDILPSIS